MIADRVKESATVSGTGAITLTGAWTSAYVTFGSIFANGARCFYVIENSDNTWECGLGTYNTSGNTISRTTVLMNSSGTTSAISFGAGTKVCFCDLVAEGFSLTGAAYSVPRTGSSSTLDVSWIPNHNVSKLLGGTLASGVGTALTNDAVGTISSGTVTPDPTTGNIKSYTNNGAHTLAPPSSNVSTLIIEVVNGASAGTITTSGFTKVDTSAYNTTNGNKFLFNIIRTANYSYLQVVALQ